MRAVSFTVLRNRAKHCIDMVESGEVVRVLRSGKPIAEIHPVEHDLSSWKRRAARPSVIGGAVVSDLVPDERRDRSLRAWLRPSVRVFFDSSVLVKRCTGEAGTGEVLAWCDKATGLAIAVIAAPENIPAFRCLARDGRPGKSQYAALKTELRADLAAAVLCETSPQVVQRAIAALEAHLPRAMDAPQIAAALVTGAQVFVSADARQCAAAARLGLQVVSL